MIANKMQEAVSKLRKDMLQSIGTAQKAEVGITDESIASMPFIKNTAGCKELQASKRHGLLIKALTTRHALETLQYCHPVHSLERLQTLVAKTGANYLLEL